MITKHSVNERYNLRVICTFFSSVMSCNLKFTRLPYDIGFAEKNCRLSQEKLKNITQQPQPVIEEVATISAPETHKKLVLTITKKPKND